MINISNTRLYIIILICICIYIFFRSNLQYFDIIENKNIDIDLYFKNYDQNFYELNDIYTYSLFSYNIHPNVKYITYSNNIIYYNLINNKNKSWELFDPIDKNKYEIFSIKFHPPSQSIIYYFNKNNPSLLIQCWSYGEFIYYGNNNILTPITKSTSGAYNMTIKDNQEIFKINTDMIVKNEPYYFFGFTSNVGHHLWNEISGMINFLNTESNFTKIIIFNRQI